MTAETTCSKCQYLCCHRDGFPGRVIVLNETGHIRNSAIPIEKCKIKMELPNYPEEGFMRATGWGVYLPKPNPELTLAEDDTRRGHVPLSLDTEKS